MKNLKSLLLGFLVISFCVNAQNPYERHWKKNIEKVRVISYNILNGFDWGKDLERQNRLVEWVKEKDPEILALEELCGFNQEKLSALAKQWGHPYAMIVKEDGYPVGVTSKKPITLKAKVLENCGHGLLHVETYGLNILVTHLNPSDAKKRNVEAQTIIKYIKDNKLTDLLLMGDMNSHSPIDADYMESHAIQLLAKYGGRQSTNLINGKFDYSVISHFLSFPMIDICRLFVQPENRVSFPTPILMGQSKQKNVRERTDERLDYIFATPELAEKAVDGFIWNGEDTYYLSDHFPVGIDLLFEYE